MAWVAVGVAAAGIVVSLVGGEQARQGAGKEAELQRLAASKRKEAAEYKANQLDSASIQEVAVAQRDMLDIQRVTKLTQSRALALTAAGGGGAKAPGSLTIISNIAKEGSYNAARALYAGEEKARVMRLDADQLRKEGEYAILGGEMMSDSINARGRATQTAATGQAIGIGAGMYGKYGGRSPGTTPRPSSDSYFVGSDLAVG